MIRDDLTNAAANFEWPEEGEKLLHATVKKHFPQVVKIRLGSDDTGCKKLQKRSFVRLLPSAGWRCMSGSIRKAPVLGAESPPNTKETASTANNSPMDAICKADFGSGL